MLAPASAARQPELATGALDLLTLQRLAGNAAVTSLLMVQRCGGKPCNCAEADRETVQRAIGSDFIVRGKFPDADKPENRNKLFFNFSSAVLDASEHAKAAKLAQPPDAELALHGFASEEGSKAGNTGLVDQRIAAVDGALKGSGHTGTRQKVPHPGQTEGEIDYRRQRVVEVQPINQSPESADCNPKPDCESTFTSGLAKARFDVSNAIGALTNPTDPDVAAALKTAFSRSDAATASAVSSKFSLLLAHFNLMAASTGHSCKTGCDASCTGGRVAVTDGRKQGGGAKAHLTLCPDFATTTEITPSELLIHEGSHGAAGVLADDLAYAHGRLFDFLHPDMALQNADSYMLFIRLFTTGVRGEQAEKDVLGPGFNAQQNADTEKTIAWVADLLERSNNVMSSNYEKVKEARAAGAWKNAGHEDLMKGVLAPRFQMTLPPKPPIEEDQWKVAGIADRYNQLRTLFNAQLKVQKLVAGGVAWESGPGRTVSVGPAFLAAPLDARVRQMVTALIAADPNISSAHKAAFVELIFEIKDRTGQTFEATEGPGTKGAGGGTTGGGSASKDGASKAGASLAARPTLRLNDSGPDVVVLQQLLNSVSARPSLNPDGQFGRLTHSAIRQLQSARGAAADGVVGPHTWSLLHGSEPVSANLATSNTYRSLAAD